MSGNQFLKCLQRLDFPKANHKDGKSFDWMFEDSVLSPFLTWYCDNLQEGNLISDQDLNEFERLKLKEDGVLEAHQLEEALQNFSFSEDLDISEDILREEIEELKSDVKLRTHRKNVLVQQRNKLSLHHDTLNERVSKMDRISDTENKQYKCCLEQSHADNSKMNICLSNLTATVKELTSLYHRSGVAATDQDKAVFLSQLCLEEYFRDEEKFTEQLHAYTKKQFFEGIAEMTNDSAGTRYEFLQVSNPVDLLVRGEKEDINLDDCNALARLQAVLPTSESQSINSLVEDKSTIAACQYAEEKLRSFKHKPYPNNMNELSNKLQDLQTNLNVVKRDVDLFMFKELPALIKNSCTQQITRVLKGDYDLKIARQDYFIGNQDQLVKELVSQRARNEFLTMAYEVESKGHRDTHRLLTSAAMLLQNSLSHYQDRLRMLEDPGLSGKRHERETVDSRDKSTSRLYELLDSDMDQERKQLFYTYSALTENSEKRQHRLASLRSSLASSNSTHDDKLSILESNLQTCESLIYPSSMATGGQPSLSPQPIVDTITQLDEMLKKLEQAVMDVIKDIDQKKKVLKTDPLLNTERELFVYFFNDPDKIRKAIDSISSQLQAQLVQ